MTSPASLFSQLPAEAIPIPLSFIETLLPRLTGAAEIKVLLVLAREEVRHRALGASPTGPEETKEILFPLSPNAVTAPASRPGPSPRCRPG